MGAVHSGELACPEGGGGLEVGAPRGEPIEGINMGEVKGMAGEDGDEEAPMGTVMVNRREVEVAGAEGLKGAKREVIIRLANLTVELRVGDGRGRRGEGAYGKVYTLRRVPATRAESVKRLAGKVTDGKGGTMRKGRE